ncbi:hypothetical protein BGZ63DRAFT_173520 [Mariannaea sp. PMI_226]|nr:hypothetical protein BGZ63DRAFT_96556 [Mariannaea sp. PMI_226]KAI5465232.1 hypothetical protein BGZ63DRAFT_173520 [Mariannaea sp. PMI_226]
MAEPEPSSFLLQMRAIGERVSQACQRVEDTKSPHLQYQEQVTALKDEDEQKWARIPPNPTKQDLKAVRQNTLRLGGQLRELELRHAATIEEDDKAYRASLEAQLKKLCRDMVDIFGRSLVIEALQEYPAELVLGSQSPGGGPPNPTEATSQENIQSAYQRNAIDPPPNTEFQDVSMQEPNSIQDHATPTNPSVPNDAPLPVNPVSPRL